MKAAGFGLYVVKLNEIRALIFIVLWFTINRILRPQHVIVGEKVIPRTPQYCPRCLKGYDDSWRVCLVCNVPLKQANK